MVRGMSHRQWVQSYMCCVLVVQVKLIEQEYLIRQEVCREFGEQLIEIEERHRYTGEEELLHLYNKHCPDISVFTALLEERSCLPPNPFSARNQHLNFILSTKDSVAASSSPPSSSISLQPGAGGAGC